ncbi:hypothetical protein HanPSC8_Chr13g0583471 [Helianthus annuus]|nr:hypothetical protein HanPSC8_Chr13g0583471 [Helianthus annuus]
MHLNFFSKRGNMSAGRAGLTRNTYYPKIRGGGGGQIQLDNYMIQKIVCIKIHFGYANN